MADIKQAAQWMKEGKKVRRSAFFDFFNYKSDPMQFHIIDSESLSHSMYPITIIDILADDWEVAQ